MVKYPMMNALKDSLLPTIYQQPKIQKSTSHGVGQHIKIIILVAIIVIPEMWIQPIITLQKFFGHV